MSGRNHEAGRNPGLTVVGTAIEAIAEVEHVQVAGSFGVDHHRVVGDVDQPVVRGIPGNAAVFGAEEAAARGRIHRRRRVGVEADFVDGAAIGSVAGPTAVACPCGRGRGQQEACRNSCQSGSGHDGHRPVSFLSRGVHGAQLAMSVGLLSSPSANRRSSMHAGAPTNRMASSSGR